MEPKWIEIARRYIGVQELPGAANSPTIMGWAKRLTAKVPGIVYPGDATPWCGLFVSEVMSEAGFTPPLIAIRASSWDAFGLPVQKPYLGAIVRFAREGGGHVAIITGQDATHYRVIGGNQGDRVWETWIAKDRAVALRWPIGADKPVMLAPMVSRTGAVSTNEA